MKIEINIPTSLGEIPLGNYQKFVNASKGSDDELFLMEQMVMAFTGLELKSIAQIKMTDLNELIISLTTLLQKEGKFHQRFKIGDIEFGFIPNLEEISFGEYVDLEKYVQDVATLHKAMAVMYRPIKETLKDRYTIHDYNGANEYAELMKFAPLEIVKGANVFFCSLEAELLQAIPTYSDKLMTEEMRTHLVKELNLQSNGGGMEVLMSSLVETLQSSMQSPVMDFGNVLLFSRLQNRAMSYSAESLNALHESHE